MIRMIISKNRAILLNVQTMFQNRELKLSDPREIERFQGT